MDEMLVDDVEVEVDQFDWFFVDRKIVAGMNCGFVCEGRLKVCLHTVVLMKVYVLPGATSRLTLQLHFISRVIC